MTRVLALAALATPALALAQASGAVDVVTSSSDPDDAFINIDECNGVGPTGPLSLRWNVALETSVPAVTAGNYRIFASNKAPVTGTPSYCQDHLPADGTFTQEILPAEPASVGSTFGDGQWPTAEFPLKASFDCTEGQGNRTIHVCIEYQPSGDVRRGGAVRTLTLSLTRPATPVGVSATPGEGALNVTWSAGSGGDAETRFYRVVVKAAGSVVSTKDDLNATDLRVEGLQNGTTYDVEVFALSEAKNLSATPGTTSGTPAPVDDFWETYNRRCDDPATPDMVERCPEEGGCGAGGAGPLGLLAVAGFLAARRRRK